MEQPLGGGLGGAAQRILGAGALEGNRQTNINSPAQVLSADNY